MICLKIKLLRGNYELRTIPTSIKREGIELTHHQIKQFELYYEILVEWNEKMNLTAITDKENDSYS
ncbi:MAG: hypothetical protein RR630_04015 [Coprobacillus sp.]